VKFVATEIPGAFVIEQEVVSDERGFFARQWCARELEAQGLVGKLAQSSISFNRVKHTLRGMHYAQGETKVVSVTRGAIYDVLVDLRPGPTHLRWVGYELTQDNRRMLYVPTGVAHGFITLEDASEVHYFISEFYDPSAARGVRYNDPAFAIRWPAEPQVISQRDATYPDYQ
jgi:dTDP-4-dehydrorhamnose 3,5-epimerase